MFNQRGTTNQKLIQGGRSNPSLDNEYAIAMAKISQTRILDGLERKKERKKMDSWFMNMEIFTLPLPSLKSKKKNL